MLDSLICRAPVSELKIEALGWPRRYSERVEMEFLDDELNSLIETARATYDSEEAAEAGKVALQDSYDNAWRELGLSSDPMITSYSATGSVAIGKHIIRKDSLTLEAAKYIRLDTEGVDDASELDTSSSVFEAIYSALGYTCSETDDEDEDDYVAEEGETEGEEGSGEEVPEEDGESETEEILEELPEY